MRVFIQKNLKNWEDWLSFIEFAYNHNVHSTTEFSLFEILYGLNPLTPMDLIALPVDKRVSLDGNRKARVVKTLHESVRQQIKKRNRVHATKANKGRKHVVFQPGDWVWMHMRKGIKKKPINRENKKNR